MSKRIWFISDPHFHHANMVAGGKIGIRSQFQTVAEMDRHIVDSINAVVADHDKLYVLGDITLDRGGDVKSLDIVRELKGRKRLILGNHDHFPVPLYMSVGFEKVLGYREMAGLLFSHIPCHPSQFYRYKGNVHGHVHLRTVMQDNELMEHLLDTELEPTPDPRYINVCVEAVNYTPILLDELVARFPKKAA